MNLAALQLEGSQLAHRPAARREPERRHRLGRQGQGGAAAPCFILGGGSPKNFMLQTEPQIQEVLGLEESGHDYFLQFTDARPDTGGLSGATPAEAMTWGKVDPEQAARHGDVLRRFDGGPAVADGLRPGETSAAPAKAIDGPARRDLGGDGVGVSGTAGRGAAGVTVVEWRRRPTE